MIGHERQSLVALIGSDLLRNGKLPLLLLVAVLISALFVVNVVHQTRQLIAEREQLVLQKDALDIEWRNLILEENVLADTLRIERIAKERLKMQHVNPEEEHIVIKP
ncbi:cell division protein FtsL [Serratia microhaemolytica]|uniref:cell division protein FtsL n=1 Tax=Serratia microhaemolytica TaxID=2675110 RepID=UPI000FDCFA58|nr:cell division protein FtsL [Serratia microhaemolytica]